jgi:hypothetical protein
MLLGNLQKGAINLTGVVVELENNSNGIPGYEWQLKITNSKMTMPFVVRIIEFVAYQTTI